jgi:hypothetical protein
MFRARASLAVCIFALTVCASRPQTGIMAADWTSPTGSGIPEQKVTIAWESRTSTTGSMTFTLGRGGQRYIGSYLLIENTASHLELEPLYHIWDPGSFEAWPVTAADPWLGPGWGMSTWVQHYDGRVVVGLHGNRGGNARCHFTLSNTELGMPGGGTGECQVDDGGDLDVRF